MRFFLSATCTSHGMGCMDVNDIVHTVRLRLKNAIALRKIAPCERTFNLELIG